ncbi:MerR family DNA-binding transcriptional regulator [Paenibacillus nasutitermitis]|uniref:HTH merR-type domain-containing protein n=1 Tax=Paenibacillus nasutitermitis TaxID=1652958 RepID=A0A916YY43_9BACL|nr:MerR family DNA-binding transcriptional regulator [Paenibacillus nasutitermitis]GGD66145.1 hypothetical protein GCM10010911_24870 [Paenibacillus nasutitermitis]
MRMGPKDVARKFAISTSTLRNYEKQGLIPPAERSPAGYRSYTDTHVAYLACLQAMAPAFGMKVTGEVLRAVFRNDTDAALWKVKEVEVALYHSKQFAQQTLLELSNSESMESGTAFGGGWMTVGEVAELYNVPATTLRHWEKVGLLSSRRNPSNNYRLYNRSHLHKILLNRVLRMLIYSPQTVQLKQDIADLQELDLEQTRVIAVQILNHLNHMNREQIRALFHLHQLLNTVDTEPHNL